MEGPAQSGQLVEGGRLDVLGIEVASDQAVTFRAPERLGQHLVGDALDAIVEILVATAPVDELYEYRESPPATKDSDQISG